MSEPSIVRLQRCQTSISSRSRCLFILLQTDQQFPELLFARSARAPSRSLPAQIHQLGDALPACAAGRSILPAREELLCVLPGLRNGLVLSRVVIFVEVVDGGLGGFYGFSFFLGGDFFAVLEGEVAAFAPLSAGR